MRAPASFFLLFVVSVVSVVSGSAQIVTRPSGSGSSGSTTPLTSAALQATPLTNATTTLLSNNMNDGTNFGSALAIGPDGSLWGTYSDLGNGANAQWLFHATNESYPVGITSKTNLGGVVDYLHQTGAIFFAGADTCPTVVTGVGTNFSLTVMTGAGCTSEASQTSVTPVGGLTAIYQWDAAPGTDGFTQIVYTNRNSACFSGGTCLVKTIKCAAVPCSATPTPNTGVAFTGATFLYSLSMVVNSLNRAVYAFVPMATSPNVIVGVNNDATGSTVTTFTLSAAALGFNGSQGINNLKVLKTSDNKIIIGFGNRTGAAMAVCTNDHPSQASDCPITQLTSNGESVDGGSLLNGVISTVVPNVGGSSYSVGDEILPTQSGSGGGILIVTDVDDDGAVLSLVPEPGNKVASGVWRTNGTTSITNLTGTFPAVGNYVIGPNVTAGTTVVSLNAAANSAVLSSVVGQSGNDFLYFFDNRALIGARYSTATGLATTTLTVGDGDDTLTVDITGVTSNIPVFSALNAANLASALYLITGCASEACPHPTITQVNNYQSDNLPAPVQTDSSGRAYISGVGYGKSDHTLFHVDYSDGAFQFLPSITTNTTGGQYQIQPLAGYPVALRMDQSGTYNSFLFTIANTGSSAVTPIYGCYFFNSIPCFTSLAAGAVTPTMQWDNLLGNQNGFAPQPSPAPPQFQTALSGLNTYAAGCPVFAAYNFSLDGGTQGLITPGLSATVPVNFVITGAIINSTTPFASGGSATVSVGLSAGASGAAAILGATAIASLSANALVSAKPSFSAPIKLTAPGEITVTVAAADLTAGYLNVCLFGYQSPI